MSENNKIGTYKFVAEPFHVDFTGRLTMGVLGNHLLNCAGFHATERGFGIATLNEDNYTWVLSRLAVMVYLCTPLIEDAETFKLSILICRRVNTAVT
jgi:hypothetical protein